MRKGINFTDFYSIFKSKSIPGRVYVVEYDDGAIKIGSTQNASERFYTLQYYYRGRLSKIQRTYISDMVEDSRECEKRAQYGLRPIEKREVYGITFGSAVRRVKKATGTKTDWMTISRADTEKEFPFLIPTAERKHRCEEKLLLLLQSQQESAVKKVL